MSNSIVIDEADLPLAWADFPPGPELGIQLAMTEWSALSGRELIAAMDAARRQATWAQSLMLEGVAELSRRRHGEDPYGGSDTHRRICGEISIELTVPTGQAEEFLVMAESLPTALPRTWAAMRTGQLDYDRARVMVDGVIGIDRQLARHLDEELIGDAVDTTKTLLRRRLTAAIKKADPDAQAERTKRAKNERRVELWDNDDDTCDLVGRNLSAGDAHAIRNRLTAAAQAMKADGDIRSVDQIRADLYRDLLHGISLPEAAQHLLTDDLPAGRSAGSALRPSGSAEHVRSSLPHDDPDRHREPSGPTKHIRNPLPDENSGPDAPSGTFAGSAAEATGPTKHIRNPPPDEDSGLDLPSGTFAGSAAQSSGAAMAPRGLFPADDPSPFGDDSAESAIEPPAAASHVTRRNTGGDSAADVIAEAERVIAGALGDVIDEQLTEVFDRARADGHLDGLAQLVGDAAQAMRDAVADKAGAWCCATSQTNGTNSRPDDADDHGHSGYRPPAVMQRLIQRRHATCVYPTCNRQSIHCDLDHTVPYDKGGRTCKCNLAPLCRTHHRIIKQNPRWKLVQPWPGLLVWVAPSGTWHIVTPQ